jgi:hypothetical protein
MVQNAHDVDNMTWPPQLEGTDLHFLDGFVDETMDPSLAMLSSATCDTLDTTSTAVNAFLPTSQALEDDTPFWP